MAIFKNIISKFKENPEADLQSFDFREVFKGHYLQEFIVKNIKLIILILFFIMLLVGNRFAYEHQMSEIARLKKELEDRKFTSLEVSEGLMKQSRPSQVKQMILNRNIELEDSRVPAYRIKRKSR